MSENQIIVYQPNETMRLDVRLENETVWLTQEQIANLFGTKRPAITKHLANIYKSGELEREGTCSIMVQNTGFGTAKTLLGSSSFCGGKGSACLTVQTISGTLVGYPIHVGACDHTPMWDLCQHFDEPEDENAKKSYYYYEVKDAVISGTWSLKYNKALTDKYASSGEKAILSKIGGYIAIDDEGVVGEEVKK